MERKHLLLLLIFISINLFYVCTLNKYNNIREALNDYPAQVKRGKKAKYITLKIARDMWTKIDYFSKILYQFFLSTGVKVHFVNMKDKELLGIFPQDSQIDRDVVLEHFKGVIEDIIITDKIQ